jgi:tetratricopeptide (TPR) repeat protein
VQPARIVMALSAAAPAIPLPFPGIRVPLRGLPNTALTLLAAPLALLAVSTAPAPASHLLADHVKDGPAAANTRESFDCLDRGDGSDDDAVKLVWYSRGKDLAEQAIRQDDGSPDAHFALFANWGRWLQTDGWLKNAFRLPALRRELDRALELDPNYADALAAKGGLYLQLPRFLGGDGVKAEALLVRAIELDPAAVGARLELADRYLAVDRRDEARDLTRTALRLATEQGKPVFIRGATRLLEKIGPPSAQAEAKR